MELFSDSLSIGEDIESSLVIKTLFPVNTLLLSSPGRQDWIICPDEFDWVFQLGKLIIFDAISSHSNSENSYSPSFWL